ncbi:hypothetical protein D3C80_1536800 [compost metagenome]
MIDENKFSCANAFLNQKFVAETILLSSLLALFLRKKIDAVKTALALNLSMFSSTGLMLC